MRTKTVALGLLLWMLLFPNPGVAQSRCLELFTVRQELQTPPRTEVRVNWMMFFSRGDTTLQGFIDKTQPVLKKLFVPEKMQIEITRHTAAGIVPMNFGCGMFNAVTRATFIHTDVYKNLSAKGREFLETTVQHEFAHYVFLMNMGRHSEHWKKWVEKTRNSVMAGIYDTIPFLLLDKMAEKQLELSVTYQEVFADLIAVLSVRKPNAMMEGLEIYTGKGTERNFKELTPEERAKEEKRLAEEADRVASRGFDKSLFDMKWNQKEEHAMLGPVRVYLWEQYFAKPKNKNREDEIVAEVFDIMAKEIIERSLNKNLWDIPPEQVNLRILRALHEGLAPYR